MPNWAELAVYAGWVFDFKLLIFLDLTFHLIDAQKAILLELFFPRGSPSHQSCVVLLFGANNCVIKIAQ